LIEVPQLPPVSTSAPPEFQGEPGYWSPEHLLVAALESCLMTTFLAIAEKSRLDVVSYRSSALAKLEMVDGSLRFTRILVRPIVELRREQDRESAHRVFANTEKNCFVSSALSVPVRCDVAFTVSDAAAQAGQNREAA
jgi:organic hydroperoxide reductase OsmC/OhrA